MNALAILLLASLPVSQVQIVPRARPEPHFVKQAAATPHKQGKWYFARTGHAVYCSGPVMTMPDGGGRLERVATFCRGDRLLVPLKD